MKRFLLLSIMLLVLAIIAACGTGRSGSGDSVGRVAPVEDWIPLVQGAPGASAWRHVTIIQEAPPESLVSADEWEAMEAEFIYHLGEETAQVVMRSVRIHYAILNFINLDSLNWWTNFPDFFAGTYICNDFHFNLVIAEGREREALELLSFLLDSSYIQSFSLEETAEGVVLTAEGIGITTAQSSFAQLRDAVDYFAWNRGVNSENDRIAGLGIDQMRNRIVVWLVDYSEEEKAYFRERVRDSPMIVFECVSEMQFGSW